jgi:hypothetical protein
MLGGVANTRFDMPVFRKIGRRENLGRDLSVENNFQGGVWDEPADVEFKWLF